MSFSCSRGFRCKNAPPESINLAGDHGVVAVKHLLCRLPVLNQARGDFAPSQTQCAHYKIVCRQPAEAPCYHRGTEPIGDVEELLFECPPRRRTVSHTANKKRREVSKTSKPRGRRHRTHERCQQIAFNRNRLLLRTEF